jgi:hypothetical protein
MHRAMRRQKEKKKNANTSTAQYRQGVLPWNEKRMHHESMTNNK